MPRFEKCDHCRYGWNNPHGCNYPDLLDPCRIDMSCYQPMTEAQKFQQKAERECKSDKTNQIILNWLAIYFPDTTLSIQLIL